MTFVINEKEKQILENWIEALRLVYSDVENFKLPPITYKFTSNGIGTSVEVECSIGHVVYYKKLTDYESW